MSLFGKILAFVNILGVLGVVALLAMNYGKRQNWEYAVFRQDLMINGLPLDDSEKDAQQQVVSEKIGKETQQDVFKQASPNSGVATQTQEVKRVEDALRSQVDTAGDKKKQMVKLATILTPMAETIEQRGRMIAYRTYLSDDKMFGVLKARLLAAHKAATAAQEGQGRSYEGRFRDALAVTFSDPPGPFGEAFLAVMQGDPKADFDKALEQSLDNQLTQLNEQFNQMFQYVRNTNEAVAQRKRAVARLLFNMVEVLSPDAKPNLASDPAYRRFFFVVGVKAALEAVNDQANVLQGLVFETDAEGLRERYLFAEEHRKDVRRVLDEKAVVDEHKLMLAAKKKETTTHAEKLAERKRDVQLYEQTLATTREETIQHLKQLREVSDQLFAERVKLREKSEDNQKLEKQLRALEEGR